MRTRILAERRGEHRQGTREPAHWLVIPANDLIERLGRFGIVLDDRDSLADARAYLAVDRFGRVRDRRPGILVQLRNERDGAAASLEDAQMRDERLTMQAMGDGQGTRP